MGKAILASLGAAAAMILWGFLSWTVLQLHEVEGLEKSGAVTTALRESGDESGVYFIPRPVEEDQPQELKDRFEELHEQGPRALVFYNKEGAKPMDPMVFVKGYSVMLLACIVLALVLAGAGIGSYLGRVLLCAAIGLVAAVHADGGLWAWFSAPTGWTVMQVLDRVVSFAVAGLVLAAVVKPRDERA